jgi:hypothetical protein
MATSKLADDATGGHLTTAFIVATLLWGLGVTPVGVPVALFVVTAASLAGTAQIRTERTVRAAWTERAEVEVLE